MFGFGKKKGTSPSNKPEPMTKLERADMLKNSFIKIMEGKEHGKVTGYASGVLDVRAFDNDFKIFFDTTRGSSESGYPILMSTEFDSSSSPCSCMYSKDGATFYVLLKDGKCKVCMMCDSELLSKPRILRFNYSQCVCMASEIERSGIRMI